MEESLLAGGARGGDGSASISGSRGSGGANGAGILAAVRSRVDGLMPPDFPRGECNTRFAFVLLLATFAMFPQNLTSPFILFEYTAFFNGGSPCRTDAETASAGCRAAMEHYLDVNKNVMGAQAVLGFLLFAVIGRISDSVGRRAAFIGSLLPVL